MAFNPIEAHFAPARDSVSWAKDAIAEFNSICGRFFQSNVTEVITEIDPNTGEHVQKLRLRTDIPSEARRKATEALGNTKNAFDQATFAARNIASRPSNRTVYFPWSQSPTDLIVLLKTRGIDERLWGAFSAEEPYPTSDAYPGGDNVVRTLATIANGKHTVGLSVQGQISMIGYPTIRGGRVQNLSILAPRWDSVKNEAELIRWRGEVEVQGDYEFGFEVLLKDSRLPEPVNAATALSVYADKAKTFIERLQSRCAQLQG